MGRNLWSYEPMKTEDAIQAHLMATTAYETPWGMRRDRAKCIVCADGTTISVQVGPGLYCAPRNAYGPWYQVEVGFPSKALPEIMEFAEDGNAPTETVYGYVPIEIVAAAVDACGGLKATP